MPQDSSSKSFRSSSEVPLSYSELTLEFIINVCREAINNAPIPAYPLRRPTTVLQAYTDLCFSDMHKKIVSLVFDLGRQNKLMAMYRGGFDKCHLNPRKISWPSIFMAKTVNEVTDEDIVLYLHYFGKHHDVVYPFYHLEIVTGKMQVMIDSVEPDSCMRIYHPADRDRIQQLKDLCEAQ